MSEHDLRAYQGRKRERTVELVRNAISQIDAELALGPYPHNGGRLNRKEVCRRAGIGESTLKNATHSETARLLSDWLRRVSPPKSQKAETCERNSDQQLVKLARELDLFKLRFEGLKAENRKLTEELARATKHAGKPSASHLKLVTD